MSKVMEKYRLKLQDLARQIMSLLSDVNETEKTVSRLKNELTDMYKQVDDSLNGD
jgi:predicted RNase H-like nuclease (RuvC/YqgF family)